MPARRSRRNRKTGFDYKLLIKRVVILSVVILLSLFIVEIFIKKGKWVAGYGASVVFTHDDNTSILFFDHKDMEINRIDIPSDSIVSTSYGLGQYKVDKLWQLGKDQNKEGVLLTASVMKNFSLPVVAYVNTKPDLLYKKSVVGRIKFILSAYKNNLSFTDRIKLAYFSFGIKDIDKYAYNLKDTAVLENETLKDGSTGYLPTGYFPNKFMTIFSIPSEKGIVTATLVNTTHGSDNSGQISKLLETLGAKVVSVEEEESELARCVVLGNDSKIVRIISDYFDCVQEKPKDNQSIDIKILMDKNFLDLFE